MVLAVTFTNFGPYHLARLRALGERLGRTGDGLLALETAGSERRYPWRPERGEEPFEWVTLFPDRALESLSRSACARAMEEALERSRPDVVAIVGYVRPEAMAALRWARRNLRPTILMSESQAIDRPRVWWKETIKRRRVRQFSAALVGGPRHRDYLVDLGMPWDRIASGYNAVDNAWYAHQAELARTETSSRHGLPQGPYFLVVSRFVPEKNLPRLIRSFAHYHKSAPEGKRWELVLCGDGPSAAVVEAAIRASGVAQAIHRPGFLQANDIVRYYAFAGALVHPSLSEPWGLVVNEAAACGLPLLVSDRAGCAETLVPDPPGTTGRRFDPNDEAEMAEVLNWLAHMPEHERAAMGQRAEAAVADWGPERFAQGTLEALTLACSSEPGRPPQRLIAATSSSKDARP